MMLLTDEEINNVPALHRRGNEEWDTFRRRQKRKVAKAQLEKVVEWGNEPCTNSKHSPPMGRKKRTCPDCWQSLLKEEE